VFGLILKPSFVLLSDVLRRKRRLVVNRPLSLRQAEKKINGYMLSPGIMLRLPGTETQGAFTPGVLLYYGSLALVAPKYHILEDHPKRQVRNALDAESDRLTSYLYAARERVSPKTVEELYSQAGRSRNGSDTPLNFGDNAGSG